MATVPALSDSQVNPLDLPLVIEQIVIYSKPKELFKCRLINKSWEKEARKQLGKKFILSLSRTTRDATFSLHPINDKGFFNYLQLNRPNLNLQGGPQLIPPLIQNLAITKHALLCTGLFTSVGPFLHKLIYNGCETHQFRSLDLILTNCINLEYLDFTTWGDLENNMITTIQNYQQVDKFRDEEAINNIKLLKMKTLVLKFTKYHPRMAKVYYKLVANILNKVPNLEVLEFPYFEPTGQITVPPGIVRALLEFMGTLTKLKELHIGYRFNNNDNNNKSVQEEVISGELFQLLSCTKFQLIDLKLNEDLLTILPIIINYQRKLSSLTASLLYFNWTIFRRWLTRKRLPTIHQQNGSLRIRLIDFYNLLRCNIMEIFLYKRQQVPIADIPLAGENLGIGNIGGRLVAFKACPSETNIFFRNFTAVLHSDRNVSNTISTLNLSNIGSLDVEDISTNLTQLCSLIRLHLKPSSDDVLKYIWSTMQQLKDLYIILGDFQQPSYVFESAICGQNVKDCYKQFIKYSQPTMGFGTTPKESFLPVIPNAAAAARISDDLCICRLQNLRRLDIKNCSLSKHFKYLTKLSIMKCFQKLSLVHLKMPYKGSKEAIFYLQAANPALDLEIEG